MTLNAQPEPMRSCALKQLDLNRVNYVEIDEAAAGQRLDNFLIKILKGVPKSHVYRIVRAGEVRVNKKRASVQDRLDAGDVVRLPPVRVERRRRPSARFLF